VSREEAETAVYATARDVIALDADMAAMAQAWNVIEEMRDRLSALLDKRRTAQ
jgi:hypothetical protein